MTPKQAELLRFIADSVAASGGVVPSYDEMAAGVGIKSKSGIQRLLTGLQERGYIRWLANRARSIEIVRPEHLDRNSVMAERERCAGLVEKYADQHGSLIVAELIREGTAIAEAEKML